MRHVDAGEIAYIIVGHGIKRKCIRFAPSDLAHFQEDREEDHAMSVYPRGKKGIYVYDFQIERVPFFGSTGCTTKRDALAFESRSQKASAAKA